MTHTTTARAWARSLVARYRTHARRIPRLILVLRRPTAAPASVTVVRHTPSYLITHVTHRVQASHRIAVRVAPQVSIALQSPGVSLVAPTGIEGRRVQRAPRAGAPAVATTARSSTRPVANATKRLVHGKPVPARFTPVRRVVRVPGARSTDETRAVIASHAPPPWPGNQTVPGPPAVWPQPPAGPAPAARTWQQEHPAIDVGRLTDQVIKAIDRRAIADRERRGRI